LDRSQDPDRGDSARPADALQEPPPALAVEEGRELLGGGETLQHPALQLGAQSRPVVKPAGDDPGEPTHEGQLAEDDGGTGWVHGVLPLCFLIRWREAEVNSRPRLLDKEP
jgi:hypothetical protein